LEHLLLKCESNSYNIQDYLPNGIKTLELHELFNGKLDNLPNGIENIYFHPNSNYNHELNCLPNKIKCIKLPINYKNVNLIEI